MTKREALAAAFATADAVDLSDGYYNALHRAETAITPILAPHMPPARIIRFAQRVV